MPEDRNVERELTRCETYFGVHVASEEEKQWTVARTPG